VISETRVFRTRSLAVGIVALVIVYILWNVPQLGFMTYPIRLFVTYVHEAGHSIMAVATGGEIKGFLVSPDGSGLAETKGGNLLLILPAGYLGAAFFGAVLFYLIHTLPQSRTISAALGLFLIVFTLAFARPDERGLPVALFVGVLSGAALLLVAWKANRAINLLVLNVLAMMTALNAVFDLYLLIQSSDASRGQQVNDAAAFSREVAPFLPGAVWAALWALIALLVLGVAVWYSVVRPLWRPPS
jgi:hypothetical protein